MNAVEAARVLALAAEVDPRVTVSRARAKTWAWLLPEVPVDDALHAVVAHYRSSAEVVMPSDVLGRVRDRAAARRRPVLSPGELRVCRAAGIPPEEWAERRSDREWVRAVSAAHSLAVPESGQDGPRMVAVGDDTKASVSGVLPGVQRSEEAIS